MEKHPIYELTLPGDPVVYKLQYDFNALCEAEEKANLNLLPYIAGRPLTGSAVRALLFALLLPEHGQYGLTLEEAGQLVGAGYFTQVTDLMLTVLKHADPAVTEDDADVVPPAPPAPVPPPVPASPAPAPTAVELAE